MFRIKIWRKHYDKKRARIKGEKGEKKERMMHEKISGSLYIVVKERCNLLHEAIAKAEEG